MNYKLSVIIPTYKRTTSLRKLLEILLRQENIELEIVVVDQNSELYFDEDLSSILRRVKWLRQDKANVSHARNKGFLASSAPYLLFIDDDLIPESDFCSDGVKVFLDYPGIESFSPLVYNDEGEGAALSAAKRKFIKSYPGSEKIFSITDTISAAIFFKREAFERTGGFDHLLFEFARTAEDQEFFLRMLRKQMTLWFVPLVKIYHDEKIPGGCDLRSDDYWITREKCMRAWALRYRTYDTGGRLRPPDLFRLLRSSVLNKEVLSSSPKYIIRQISLMIKAVRQSRFFFHQKKQEYVTRIKEGFLG